MIVHAMRCSGRLADSACIHLLLSCIVWWSDGLSMEHTDSPPPPPICQFFGWISCASLVSSSLNAALFGLSAFPLSSPPAKRARSSSPRCPFSWGVCVCGGPLFFKLIVILRAR